MKNLLKISILFLVFATLLSSCILGHLNAIDKTGDAFTVENGAIPPDFGEESSHIFLVLRAGMKHYDRYLEKAVAKYHGKYEYTMKSRMDQKKYADKDLYRYYFDYDPGTQKSQRNEDGSTYDYSMKQFFVYDRLKDIKYKCGKEFGKYGVALNSYFSNLEKKRMTYN